MNDPDKTKETFIRVLYEIKDRQNVLKLTVFLSDGRSLTGYVGSYLPLLELVRSKFNFEDAIEITRDFIETDDGFWFADAHDDSVADSRYPLVYIFFTALNGFVYRHPLGIRE